MAPDSQSSDTMVSWRPGGLQGPRPPHRMIGPAAMLWLNLTACNLWCTADGAGCGSTVAESVFPSSAPSLRGHCTNNRVSPVTRIAVPRGCTVDNRVWEPSCWASRCAAGWSTSAVRAGLRCPRPGLHDPHLRQSCTASSIYPHSPMHSQ